MHMADARLFMVTMYMTAVRMEEEQSWVVVAKGNIAGNFQISPCILGMSNFISFVPNSPRATSTLFGSDSEYWKRM